ncbi:MAG: ATP-binding protein [Ardenticatenaceae bacterium]|nr:ATP-binding protein [Ardenticatenaceae bacterium]
MGKTIFKGRSAELQLLDELWDLPRSTLLILYGRRRVGKTRLLTHWLEKVPENSLYWVAEPTSAYDQLRSFSQALYNYAHPDTPAPPEFTYATWEQAFQQLARMSEEQKIAIFIDEVTYLIDVNPKFVGTLQKVWDHYLSEANLLMALSGSQMGMMQKQVLSYDAPLYGRATAQVKLPPLPFDVTTQFFPDYSAKERVALYGIFGGIPAYWERLDPQATIFENIYAQLLTSNSLMQEEPRLLLQDFLTDPYNYVSIMRAIAHGANTQSKIGRRTGLSQGHVSKYLGVLRETGFVERQVPVTESAETSRRGRYFVTDPYLRFYYRFLSTNQAQLAMGGQQKTLQTIQEQLDDFVEQNTWRDLCREWLSKASQTGMLPFDLEKVGGAWTRSQEAGLAAIDRPGGRLILGDCFWGSELASGQSLQSLIRRTPSLLPKTGEWEVYYITFSSAGWTDEAQALARQFAMRGEQGKRWRAAGVELVELSRINEDLAAWGAGQQSLVGSQLMAPVIQPRLFNGVF